MITKLAINQAGRDFVVGDLHGCLKELLILLRHVNFDEQKDRLIAVGDLIDRGKYSLGCLSLLKYPWFYAVLGNHEQMLIDYMVADEAQRPGQEKRWRAVGGGWFFALDNDDRQRCYAFATERPWVIQVATKQYSYCVVHAEIPPEIDNIQHFLNGLQAQDANIQSSCLWGRRRHRLEHSERIAGIDYVLCGHTPGESKRLLGNMLNLDYGAFDMAHRGGLCLFELESNRSYILRNKGIEEKAGYYLNPLGPCDDGIV